MDFILACADGLSWRQLAPFVRSARGSAPAAKVVLFIHALDDATRAKLRRHDIDLQPLDALFPGGRPRSERARRILWWLARRLCRMLRYPEFKRRLLDRAGGLLLPRNQARFFTYRAFLEACTCPGDRTLICDARDLVFQDDPFAVMPRAGLVLTEESTDVPLRSNRYNAQWLRETYGAAALQQFGSQRVVCAGAFGGEHEALLRLLDNIILESLDHPTLYGADQAILNFLHGSGRIVALVTPNQDSLAWHLYGVREDDIRVDAAGRIVDGHGHVYPIVHMYDRHPRIEAAVLAHWRAET